MALPAGAQRICGLVCVSLVLVSGCSADEDVSRAGDLATSSSTAGQDPEASGDEPFGSGSSSAASSKGEPVTSGDATGGATSSTSGSSDTGAQVECPVFDMYNCGPRGCGDVECGGASIYDEDGCLRPACDGDSDCEVGDICYGAHHCDPEHCGLGPPACEACDEERDGCCCSAVGGCGVGTDWTYCIPAEARPC